MAPFVGSLLLTLAALGAVFVFVLVGCAFDGLRTLRAWLRFSRGVRELDGLLVSILAAVREHAHAAEHEAGEHVARVHRLPLIGPCERDDCPRGPGPGKS